MTRVASGGIASLRLLLMLTVLAGLMILLS